MARATVLVSAVVEGQVLADEVMAGAERIQTLAASGSRSEIANTAGRLGFLAFEARRELRKLAQGIDS